MNVTAATFHLAPNPYDCHKYVRCTADGHFSENKTVENGNVYNPKNGKVADPNILTCAVNKRYINLYIFSHLSPSSSC